MSTSRNFKKTGDVLRHLAGTLQRESDAPAVSPRSRCAHDPLAGTASRGICRYLKVGTWRSEAMYRLPNQGEARLLYLFLLTGPHTLTCHVPGLYQVGKEGLREELRLKPTTFKRALQDLQRCIGLQTDFARSLVWAPTALEHLGPPANPNIVLSYCRALSQMPDSPLVQTAICAYHLFLANLGDSFLKPFQNHFKTVCEPFGIEREIEIEKETEKERQRPQSESSDSVARQTGQQLAGNGGFTEREVSLLHLRKIRVQLEGPPNAGH